MGNDKYEKLKKEIIDATLTEELKRVRTITDDTGFQSKWIDEATTKVNRGIRGNIKEFSRRLAKSDRTKSEIALAQIRDRFFDCRSAT